MLPAPIQSAARWVRTWWHVISAVLVVVAGFYITFQFVEPPPPKSMILAGGREGGGYHWFADKFAADMGAKKISVEVLSTGGSDDNLQRMLDPETPIGAAFVQGGTLEAARGREHLVSLGSIYFEPIWVFHRQGLAVESLRSLKGRRVAVGLEGSGTRRLALRLLEWNGVGPENSTLVDVGGNEAAADLMAGRLDAVILVESARSPAVRRLVEADSVRLHSFRDAEAYLRQFEYLTRLTLPAGLMDMTRGLPATDVVLIAPCATLVAREDLHPSLVYLILRSAAYWCGPRGMFNNEGDFPNGNRLELPLHREAARYYRSGDPFLQQFLPYHVAAWIDRMKILLLPVLTLLIPLIRILPPTYRWSIRRKIWKIYKDLHRLEDDRIRGRCATADLIGRLAALEERSKKIEVPAAYASELYLLRQHLGLVRRTLEEVEASDA
jgi:TRAP transporter TAXI family solute receptor